MARPAPFKISKTEDTSEAPAVEVAETAAGKEFTVLQVRDNGDAVLDLDGAGSMFKAKPKDGLKVNKGDVVRVSYDKTDENDHPVDAVMTSVK